MSILHAIVLGIVQGLTEFLPISSSGHLVLVPELFGWSDPGTDVDRAFDVAVHIGTLGAAVAYFRTDLGRYVKAGTEVVVSRRIEGLDARIACLLAVATIPAIIIGGVFDDAINDHLTGPMVVGTMLIVFGVLLGIADHLPIRRHFEDARIRNGWVLGLAQAVALIPGTSRSGVTITAGRALGFDREAATRLAFLMVVPVTFVAGIYVGIQLVAEGFPTEMIAPFLVGMITSGLTAYLAIWWLLRFVRNHGFMVFVIYRIALGLFVLAWFGLLD